jgi:hypothetical protein
MKIVKMVVYSTDSLWANIQLFFQRIACTELGILWTISDDSRHSRSHVLFRSGYLH